MSYLMLPKGVPDFSKAVISLWFRVPKKSVEAAANHNLPAGIDGFFLLQNILPLVTFGEPTKSILYLTPIRSVYGGYTGVPGAETPPPAALSYRIWYENAGSYEVDPSLIGLYCNADGTFQVVFNLQTSTFMSFIATTFVTTSIQWWSGSDPGAPTRELGNGVIAELPYVGRVSIENASYTDNRQAEWFFVQANKTCEPDRWHHLLMSFDIGGAVSIGTPFASSSCRLWYAIDDVDYRGAANMQPYRNTDGQWGPDNLADNAILTRNAFAYSGSDPNWQAIQYYENHYVGLPQGTYSGGSIPSSQAEFGIPAGKQYVDGIFQVEMAEFQMWTDKTLDTGSETKRRAFIDCDRDENDQPIPNDDGTLTMKPVPMNKAEELIGKKQDIILHGTKKWQEGFNTGSLGFDDDGEPKPSGQFIPTGRIDPYKPEPSLTKQASSSPSFLKPQSRVLA